MGAKSRRQLRHIAWLLVFITLLWGDFGKPFVCRADEKEEAPSYNASGSIVQVVLLYQDENGVYHMIQSGSGVLLDEHTVITNRQVTTLSDASKTAGGEYLSNYFERPISFYPTDEEGVEVASCQLAVVIEADIYDMATVGFSSNDWDVAILSLSSPMSKEYAVLGDSDQIDSGKLLTSQGFPDVSCTDPISFQLTDLCINEGVCADRAGGTINHTASFCQGSTGGAIVDEYGRVVGIATYTGNEAEIFSALPINQVKAYLDRDGVAYKEDTKKYGVVEEEATPTEAPPNVHTTVKNDLYRTLCEAQIIYDEGNADGTYTEESFRNFQVEFGIAQEVYDDENSEQLLIDDQTKRLREAIDSLEKVVKKNTTLFVVIIVAAALFVIIVTILIILLAKSSSDKKKEKEEQQRIRTIGGNSRRNQDTAAGNSGTLPAFQNSRNIGLPSSQLYAQFDAKSRGSHEGEAMNAMGAGTTVLQEEGTTVLNSFVQAPINAYLYRSSTGESVAITSEVFYIGKSMEGIEYRVDGNTNISRRHAVITRNFENYYIEDLDSTNYTFVNSVRVMPNRKHMLQSNDVIYLADEEFIFMINS